MIKKTLNSKVIRASLAVFAIGIAAIIIGVFVNNYICKRDAITAEVLEIAPAVNDEDFAIGVIKSDDGNDDLVVIDSKNGREIIVPTAVTEIITGQDADEMRGGIAVIKNGFGEIVNVRLYVPEDAVMREYIK